MNCSSEDLKAYFLGELSSRDKAPVEDHVRGCQSCREELERLKLTHTALLALEEEEVPRRISFVSDKVFEPRWYETIWRSGPAMGFASAVILAAAILVHGFLCKFCAARCSGHADSGHGADRAAHRTGSECAAGCCSSETGD